MRILMLGDSITHGGNWEELLEREDISNCGMPGWTTDQILMLIRKLVTGQKFSICFYMAGVNDYSLGSSTTAIERNSIEILDILSKNNITPVYQTLLYLLGNEQINAEIDTLNDRMKDYCIMKRYEYLDLRPFLCKNGDLAEEYTYDGVHLTPAAYIPWSRALKPVLKKYRKN